MTTTAFYDADCGFCTATIRRVRRWPLGAEFVALQDVDLDSLGISREHALTEMAAQEDGRVVFGHHAWAAILRTGSAPLRALARVIEGPGVNRLAALIYRAVAENRTRLPGGSATCDPRNRPV